jgi:hypothetical protein
MTELLADQDRDWPCCYHCDHDPGYRHAGPCTECDYDLIDDEEAERRNAEYERYAYGEPGIRL